MRVLITDDSFTIRMILSGLLKQLQITDIVEAPDGAKAMEAITQGGLDLVLLDIHMPNMDGMNCLQAIKKIPSMESLPVIIISSDTNSSQIKKAQELGAHAFIQKPFRIEGLKEAIATAVPHRFADLVKKTD